jgi:Fe-S-cluster containining protein
MKKPSDHYRQLVAHVDELTARLSARYAAHLACRAGCSGCCHHHLSVFPVEAATLREAIRSLPPETQTRLKQQAADVREREACGLPVACPMLIDDKCAVYESRPLICRTQGLPLLIEAEDGAREVDFCPLNFTAPDATDDLDEEHLVPLNSFNFQLAVANLLYCRKAGISHEESGARVAMCDVIPHD